MFDNKRPQPIDFVSPKAMGLRLFDRFQPKLRDFVAVFDVDVYRLRSFKAIKEETKA